MKLSAFTCRTDEAVSKQCDSEALIHPFDDVRKKNWPKPGKFFTVCFGPPSQSIGRGRLSRKGALDVRESREGRDKIVPKIAPEKQEKRNFGLIFFHFFEQDRLLCARVDIGVTEFPTETAKKEEFFLGL